MSTYAIDTAARFGDIPFVEFTRDLITGVFDSLVEAHILQVEEYTNFVSSLTDDLSTYINNTVDGVSFDEITDFILAYELPTIDDASLATALGALETPTAAPPIDSGVPATTDTWWGGLINGLAPAVAGLVDKIDDPSEAAQYQALLDYNDAVLAGTSATIPNYDDIHRSIASLIASNKYSVLQNMAKQGMMRLVVTEGEIETKITFSTWNTSSSGTESTSKNKSRTKTRSKQKIRYTPTSVFKKKKERRRIKNRTVTINTAKSYQRDSSGTKVDIFGRVLIKFKTDYAPLNG